MILKDIKDIQIVSQLRENARIPFCDIGRTVKLCRSTVAEKVKAFQFSIIRRYTCLIDFRAVGYTVRLSFLITLAGGDKAVFSRYMQHHPNTNNLYKTRGNGDYLVEMVFQTQQDAEEFLSALQNAFTIHAFHVFFIEQDVLRESFLQNARRFSRLERL